MNINAIIHGQAVDQDAQAAAGSDNGN